MRTGNVLIAVGVALVVIGVVISRAPWLVSWFGRLPGDVHIENETTKVFIPITSMLVVGVAVSVVLWWIRRLGG